VVLMRKLKGVEALNLLMLSAFLISFFAVPALISVLHLPEEMQNALSLSSQIASAVGAVFAALMTARSIEASKVERLRKSFKAIAKELHKTKKNVEMNLENIEKMLKRPIALPLVKISLGGANVPEDVIRKDFELHYRKGLKLLKHIKECNSKIKDYNEKYNEFRDWLEKSIAEKLKEMGIGVDSGFSAVRYVLSVDDHTETVLMGLDEVFSVHKGEEKLSKELASLYREIRSSKEFQERLNSLRSMAEKEVKPCLDKLGRELNKVINDIMRRYVLSEQEVAAKED